MESGILVISLDFELHWGVFDALDKEYDANIIGGREVIPEILNLFTENGIHATWATVGFLFADSKEELDAFQPSRGIRPSYQNKCLSPYQVKVGKNETEDPLHYAVSLIETIGACVGQEIGTHTFSHYYCLEPGQTKRQFEADLKAAVAMCEKKGISLQSIVFPKNQINRNYLLILKDHGINVYRGNPYSYIYKAESTSGYNRIDKKILRLLDSYINLTGYNTFDRHNLVKDYGVLNLPGSAFLRPYNKRIQKFEKLKIKRIKDSMLHAAKNNEIYHLWWHPHNFGKNTQENLNSLNELISYYNILNKEFGFRSMNMNEVASNFSITGKLKKPNIS